MYALRSCPIIRLERLVEPIQYNLCLILDSDPGLLRIAFHMLYYYASVFMAAFDECNVYTHP
jgi:hypothetical protein